MVNDDFIMGTPNVLSINIYVFVRWTELFIRLIVSAIKKRKENVIFPCFIWIKDFGFFSLKVKNAQRYNASGIIMYTDPSDFNRGNTTYPNSWWMPPSGLQRGTVGSDGDYLTPLYPATGEKLFPVISLLMYYDISLSTSYIVVVFAGNVAGKLDNPYLRYHNRQSATRFPITAKLAMLQNGNTGLYG